MNVGLETIVKLVNAGAAGAAIACMLISAYLLITVLRQRDTSTKTAKVPELKVKVAAVKSYMNFSAFCLFGGLLLNLVSHFMTPQVNITLQVEPMSIDPGLEQFRPTIRILSDEREQNDVMRNAPATDKDTIQCRYDQLLQHMRDMARIAANQQGPNSRGTGF